MPSRRVFLKNAAVAAAALSTSAIAAAQLAQGETAAAATSPKATPRAVPAAPRPSPTPSPGPSKLARELAGSLQRDLPAAHLSDSMTEKIASDINDNLVINKTFRNQKNRALPPPDFMFVAEEGEQA
ncbi:MAG TPA: twin-arginine translocation signal domain-containing protein [Candidatus Eremiobacteraceae bacterium]|nr:twin-arginine translocation signal domain-containing protein [Candidatus Eremiobacteraceae bacterium]